MSPDQTSLKDSFSRRHYGIHSAESSFTAHFRDAHEFESRIGTLLTHVALCLTENIVKSSQFIVPTYSQSTFVDACGSLTAWCKDVRHMLSFHTNYHSRNGNRLYNVEIFPVLITSTIQTSQADKTQRGSNNPITSSANDQNFLNLS